VANTLKLFGPPGTGKTHTLLGFLEKELRNNVHPKRIAYLSFTVAARQEATTRAQATLNIDPDDLEYFRTLHSVAYRQLDMTGAGLITRASDLDDFAELVGMEFNSQAADAGLQFGVAKGDQYLAFDHYRRHRGLTVEKAYRSWPDPLPWWEVEYFCRSYHDWKTSDGWSDFTDLLETGRGLYPLDVDVVFVDEAQDLSLLQWKALDVIAAKAKRIYIAGDDDQAIFSWAGAEPEEFLRREGEISVLDQSYRLPRSVHNLAGDLIQRIRGERQAKEWRPRKEEGRVRQIVEWSDIQIPDEGSVLILYRNHYLAADPERLLRDHGLPYTFNNRRAPGLTHAPAVIHWHKLTKGEAVTRRQVVNTLTAMKGTERIRNFLKSVPADHLLTLSDLAKLGLEQGPELQWWEALDTLPREEIQYIRTIGRRFGPSVLVDEPRVRLSTIHAAKGAEADHVILLTQVSRRVRKTIDYKPDAETRVFYVGVTRARETLTLVGEDNPLFKGLL